MESNSEEDEPIKKKTKIQRVSQNEPSTSNFMNAKADNGGTIVNRDNTVIGQQINNYVSESAVHGPTSLERDSLERETNDLSEKLKEWYKDIKLPNVPWMDEGDLLLGSYYVDLKLDAQQCTSIEEIDDDDETDDETDDHDGTISIEDIFDENAPVSHGAKGIEKHEKAPKRILISAPPGYGKTTLAHKIIYDWVQQEKEYVKRFKLAFLIKLRYLKNNVQNEIVNIAKLCGFESTDAVSKIVSKNASSTLVILDGFDELKSRDRIKVFEVLFRSELSNATVVTTCRTGCYSVTREEKDRLFNGIEKSTEFQDRTVTIQGLKKSNREKLLRMFVKSPDKDEVINRVRKIIDDAHNYDRGLNHKEKRKLFQCPLFVILLAFILQEKSDVVIETKNDLYKCLFDCIIRRSCCKNGTELPNDFTVFGTQDTWANYRNVVYQFGKMSTEALNDEFKSLHFDCNEKTNDIYEMGFFIKHCDVNNFSKTYYYETFHLSILEFASAYSLWLDYKTNDCVIKNETIRKIIPLFKDDDDDNYSSLSLSISFLFGLLNDELSNLLNDLVPYVYCFSTFNIKLSYFDDCKSASNFSDTVHVLFPKTVSSYKTTSLSTFSLMYRNNLQLWNKLVTWKTLRLDSVTGRDFTLLSQTETVVVKYLHIVIESSSTCDVPKEFNFSNIRCKKLKFTFEFHAKNIEMWLQIFNAITATETKRLEFFYEYHCFSTSVYTKHLAIATNEKNFPKFSLVKLKTDTVRDITNLSRIVTESFTQFGATPGDVVRTMSVFANLQALCVINCKSNLDISLLTNFGKKHWDSVHLRNVELVNCSSELDNNKCISSFRNLYCVNSPAVFGSIEPDILHCDDGYIIEAFKSSSLFLDRWKTVKELILEISVVKNYTEIMSCLAILCRSHTPKIRLRIYNYSSQDFDCDGDCVGTCNEHALIDFLKSIDVTRSTPDVTEILFTYDPRRPLRSHCESCLFRHFARTVHEKQIRLDTLIICQNSAEGWINDAFTCVSNGNVIRCIVVLDSKRRISLDVVNQFDFTEFNIQLGYCSDYFKRQHCWWSFDSKVNEHQCICISLK